MRRRTQAPARPGPWGEFSTPTMIDTLTEFNPKLRRQAEIQSASSAITRGNLGIAGGGSNSSNWLVFSPASGWNRANGAFADQFPLFAAVAAYRPVAFT